jgi:hypothetical protein
VNVQHLIGFNVVLGVWLLVLPFFFGYPVSFAMWNDIVVGLVLIGCSWCFMANVPRRLFFAAGATLCGVWLILTPMVLSYPFDPSVDAVVGTVVIVIGASEMWRVVQPTRSP